MLLTHPRHNESNRGWFMAGELGKEIFGLFFAPYLRRARKGLTTQPLYTKLDAWLQITATHCLSS
jgi:hypothetical protein